jgi:hypothetical protein
MIGFVDNSTACVNDFLNPDKSPDVLFERATTDVQLWNDLLCCSGDALEIPECAYHLAHYGFSAAGGPVLRTLHQSQTTSRTSLQYIPPYAARKTLGCYYSSSDNFKKSLAHIAATTKAKSDAPLHNFINVKSAHRYYYSVFLPSESYSFPTNVIPEGQLRNIQNASMRPIINRLRLRQVISPCHFLLPSITRRHWPPAVLRRTRLLKGGTSFETLPSEYNRYHLASHCPCLVPTYERNQSPHPRSTFHHSTASRDFLLSKFTGLPFRHSIRPRSGNVLHSFSPTGRRLSSDRQDSRVRTFQFTADPPH